jgi:hypothetical protein
VGANRNRQRNDDQEEDDQVQYFSSSIIAGDAAGLAFDAFEPVGG